MAEECKIAVRNQRREANELFKELKNDKEISEDEFFKSQEDVQKITDEFIKNVADLPLAHQPGSRWSYGIAHDVLGVVVEVTVRLKPIPERVAFDSKMRDTLAKLLMHMTQN